MNEPILQARGLTFAYGETPVVDSVDFAVAAGELVGVIGPNGSGKSTLLALLLGLLVPGRGEVLFRGAPLGRRDRRELARHMALVPQETHVAFPFRVEEIVMMGRYPHLSRFGLEGDGDRQAVEQAMTETATLPLAQRLYNELSGGEKQRVLLASALAQGADLLFLDEPTAALDIRYQVEMFRLLSRLHAGGQTIVVALHDLNLAANFCDRVVLLDGGRVVASGPPAEVLTAERLAAVYGIGVRLLQSGDGPAALVPQYRDGAA